MTDDVTGLSAYFLTKLRGPDPACALAMLENSIRGYPHSSPELVQLAAAMAEDTSPATSRDPDAKTWCSWCGAPGDLASGGGLEPGPDGPDWPERFCRDQDECIENRSRWYPPDWSKVPLWLTNANQAADAGEIVRLAADQAAREFIAELSQRSDAGVLKLSGTGGGTDPDALPALPWQPVPYQAKTGAAAVHPHLGKHLHRKPGGTISGLEGGDWQQGQSPGIQPQRLPPQAGASGSKGRTTRRGNRRALGANRRLRRSLRG